LSLWLWGPDPEPRPQYDETIHELHAATETLRHNVNELHQVASEYFNTNNPLIALTITLLNQQQMRSDDDLESHT
jgi:hypothetical protein